MRILLCLLLPVLPSAADPSARRESASATVAEPPISEFTAYNWAAAGTLGTALAGGALVAVSGDSEGARNLGVGLILTGLMVGPSLGQYYADSYLHGIAATALRGLGAYLAVAGAVQSTVGLSCEESAFEGPFCSTSADAKAWTGTIAYFGGVAYSLVETHFAVRRRTSETRTSLRLVPSLTPTHRGDLNPGLLVQARF